MSNIIQRSPLLSRFSRLNPFRDDDLFNGSWIRPVFREMELSPEIKIDLTENETGYTVRAEIPGAKKDDIKVNLDGNRVAISAEFKEDKEEKKNDKVIWRECSQGSSYRSFTLDSEVDESRAEATYDDGVLILSLPKKHGATGKSIKIK
jgi:HSP20 family protein